MTTIDKLRTLARELAGEAWDYERRWLAAQAYVRREAAKMVMTQADTIQTEDEMFEDPPMGYDRGEPGLHRCCGRRTGDGICCRYTPCRRPTESMCHPPDGAGSPT